MSSIGARFAAERERIGLGVAEAADLFGITRQQVGRIERDRSVPGGEVLAALAKAGGDVALVLTGLPGRGIDTTLLGIVEAAVAAEYQRLRGAAAHPERLKGTAVAKAYNRVLEALKANDDVGEASRAQAVLLLASLDDPSDPELLERNLLRPAPRPLPEAPRDSTSINVAGDGNRVAGRDIQGKG